MQILWMIYLNFVWCPSFLGLKRAVLGGFYVCAGQHTKVHFVQLTTSTPIIFSRDYY